MKRNAPVSSQHLSRWNSTMKYVERHTALCWLTHARSGLSEWCSFTLLWTSGYGWHRQRHPDKNTKLCHPREA
ncbi:hypothetical protein T11_16306 [Trichinella zimbabwensis]|uniref:Uncharacterized protein n=1 Tax=Trichinella zimbabwensis TaxID=268475 RepID=A0A0V1HBR8_9BILA|nr:hypothetical protein T11_16306 [Trichinella zimbabwensis]